MVPVRFDGYIRVSRVGKREGDTFISPDVQRDQITGWAKLRGVEIVAWHEDLDQSGGKLHRPGLDMLLARLDRGETQGVAIAKLDRLSRLGVADALKLVERITDAGGSIAALDLGLDPTTPFGEFGMTIMLALSRMERRRLADSWAIAQTRAIDRGVPVSPTPFGYDRGNDGRLVPNEDARHVRRAYQLAAVNVADATVYLTGNAAGRYWTTHTVRRLLGRRVYLGEARYGDQVNTAAHEPLVKRREWEAAQHSPRARTASADYPLSGVAICGTCGAPMHGGSRTSSGRRAYRCSAAQTLYRGERCGAPAAITGDYLEEHARTLVVPLVDGFGVTGVATDPQLEAAADALDNAEEELSAFASDLTARRALGDTYHAHLQARSDAADTARAVYRSLASAASTNTLLTGPQIVEDPKVLAVALRSMRLALRVRRGRGPVADRVALVPHEFDVAAE